MNECERIRLAYAERDRKGKKKLYSLFKKDVLYTDHERERVLLELLSKYQFDNFNNIKALDIGCGKGRLLQRFVDYGAEPANLYGIDLLEERIEKAKKLNPNFHFENRNADSLPYPDNYFNLISVFTVFSSILSSTMKIDIVKEMDRVLKKGGCILWYDYFISDPRNQNTKGVSKKEIYNLFKGYKINLRRVTLAPPIARILAPLGNFVYSAFANIIFLKSHYIGLCIKQ